MTYFPYLRGKQYELLALREYLKAGLPHDVISPIIEPVKLPLNGLNTCLQALRDQPQEHIVVGNPTVGELTSPNRVHPELVQLFGSNGLLEDPHRKLGLIVTAQTDVSQLLESVGEVSDSARIALIHKERNEQLSDLETATRDRRSYDVLDSHLRQRHYRGNLQHSVGVTLQDGFTPEARNADFLDKLGSVFSEEHLYFKDESWGGFSDYLTIGQQYLEGGFSPRAVAIHWTYAPQPDRPIMIRHFTSESNQDPANVAGKFLEAARKLVSFLDEENIHTYAAAFMRSHVAGQTYPGLGTVKKLSILNHLEVVARLLERP